MPVPGDEQHVRIVAVDLTMGQLFNLSVKLLLVSMPAVVVVSMLFGAIGAVMLGMLGALGAAAS